MILKEKGLGSNDLSAKYMSPFLRVFLKVGKKVNISNQYNQVPHPTQNTIREKYLTQLRKGVCSVPADDHKAARNRQDSMNKTLK